MNNKNAGEKNSKKSTDVIPKNFPDVLAAEKKHLNLDGKNVSGLAISGGGIRSASFGLGVMQALVANRQLEKMDYMSTVSGGGYLGSALTWALKQSEKAGTTSDTFPIGSLGKAARSLENEGNMQNDTNNNLLLDFIRQHSSYLTPAGSLDIVSLAGVVMRSIVVSLFVYFCFLVVVMTMMEWGHFFQNDFVSKFAPDIFKINGKSGVFLPLAAVSLGLYLIWSFLFSLRTFITIDGVLNEYIWFVRSQQVIGVVWKFAATCVIIGILPFLTEIWLPNLKSLWAASGSTVFGVVVGLWQYKKAQKKETTSGAGSNLIIYLGAFCLMYGLILMAYFASGEFFDEDRLCLIHPFWMGGFVMGTVILGLFVNLNLVGPHRVWRNRLMEAFMPNKDAVKNNKWQPATESDAALMEDMCDEHNPRPYHIVNTNIILGNSPQVKFSGRGGDNFILSPLYCGSDATGWRTTKTFHKAGSRGITLASAMAASAAALNPNAGVSGEGATRNTIVSILLSTLNLRLGYWVSNPAKNLWPFPPNFFTPGLTSEITKFGFTENNKRILLSDGGHFENLAVYELIRRKVNLIVLSDGGADPSFNFDDLANAVEKVRVDFGAKIAFKKDYDLDGILPGTKGKMAFDEKYAIAERGYAFADIKYNDGTIGTLVYVKLAMIADLPTDVYSYKGVNSSFPHQSTADQFFDEKQFEAYRELGYNVAWKMMESEEGMKLFS